MDKPAEILVFEYLAECCEGSAADSVLYPLELHDTIYQAITKPRGIRISDCISDVAPMAGGGLKEYDAELQIVCYARVEGKDKKQRLDAMQAVYEIEMAVIGLIIADQYLGERVCDTVVGRSPRSYDSFDGNPYAVAVIPLVINPT